MPRPPGPLIWLHAGDPKLAEATRTLALRLRDVEEAEGVLVTGTHPPKDMTGAVAPADTLADARAFLTSWRPDAAVVIGFDVPPTLLVEAARKELPVLHVAGDTPPAQQPGPRVLRPLFETFVKRTATGAAGLAHVQALGATDAEVVGRLADAPDAPPCNDAEREDLTRLLAGRPVWLAVGAVEDEADALIAAQRHAGGYSHRLLHVVRPADPAAAPAFRARFDAAGFRTLLRSDGQDPDRDVQVVIADDPGEDGLWYRLAVLTFFGGTFGPGTPVPPWGAAALGSAMIHGPETRPEHAAFDRFARAGATAIVPAPDALGRMVAKTASPEVAAKLAHAAWREVSAGTEATDRIAALALRLLDA